jgi:hypothetical protein
MLSGFSWSEKRRAGQYLERTTPEVLQRIVFDSDADAFSFYAKSQEDIRAVAVAVEELKS